MTDEKMALLELIEKGADADLVRELPAFASERLMMAEADQRARRRLRARLRMATGERCGAAAGFPC